jgi:polyphosphate kinase 2
MSETDPTNVTGTSNGRELVEDARSNEADEERAKRKQKKREKKERKALKKRAKVEKKARKAEKKAAKKARKAEERRREAAEGGQPEPSADGAGSGDRGLTKKQRTKLYEKKMRKLQVELVKLQEWIKDQGLKVVVIFEGRDAAGKGGAIKRITECLNPRVCRVVALPSPTERERSQWYFQRYVTHLPAAGEMVLLDRSWYNRAGVERVMGFCTEEEYREFLRSCPEFERMLVRCGIILIKYWFSVSDDEQEKRFQDRIGKPTKRWKLSPMDLESRARWEDFSKAKDAMFAATDIKQAPWYVVEADDKARARLNVISHLLSLIPYKDLTPEPLKLPPRQRPTGYVRPPMEDQTFVPNRYPELAD